MLALNHLGMLHLLIHIKIFSFIKIALYESSKTHALPEERVQSLTIFSCGERSPRPIK